MLCRETLDDGVFWPPEGSMNIQKKVDWRRLRLGT